MRNRLYPGLFMALAGPGLFAAVAALPASSEAATVYCTGGPGVPKGCVMRPIAPVVYCTAPGVPVGCVAHPSARAATRTPTNRNGGVNRVGVRR